MIKELAVPLIDWVNQLFSTKYSPSVSRIVGSNLFDRLRFIVARRPNEFGPARIICPLNQNVLKRIISVLALCLLLGTAQAGVTLEEFKFDTRAEEQHFKKLIEEFRCLVCQNQSLADSDAELAHDLRAELYDMVQAGKTDAEIIEFLVARYGDFVLYNPPVKSSTWLIWFGPFVLLLIAAVLLLRSIRRQQKVPVAEISAEDRKRLDAILGNTTSGQDKDP